MHRLTREVRFAINDVPDAQLSQPPTNSFAGYPSMTGLGRYYRLQLTVTGAPDPNSQYLINITHIDQRIREIAIPMFQQSALKQSPARLLLQVYDAVQTDWRNVHVDSLCLSLSPYHSIAIHAQEHPMIRLSQKFEFSASHRLHNPALSDEENCRLFGKCNNPHGHGHNYELQVTLRCKPDEPIAITAFEQIVNQTVIDRFDHRHLNIELPEFIELIPTVENIAMIIYRLLKLRFQDQSAKLASVIVWETPKTWCEYSE